eukprot:CAMPEP_0194310288 /NCGR_PEP_ID=MMETSP0171-20130528/7226_1 /TAXON_ID=218684 /ORGANISM="Corethron pennatum, Strain L29A3" /LENGTH=126 /DNA_ID=CAMNT_0039063837 /DNA_START=58 /DNA_END=437 /DNA_ORIENTATION=-
MHYLVLFTKTVEMWHGGDGMHGFQKQTGGPPLSDIDVLCKKMVRPVSVAYLYRLRCVDRRTTARAPHPAPAWAGGAAGPPAPGGGSPRRTSGPLYRATDDPVPRRCVTDDPVHQLADRVGHRVYDG